MNFSSFKFREGNSNPLRIDIADGEYLSVLTSNSSNHSGYIDDLYRWRLAAIEFKDPIPPSLESTQKWYNNNYLANDKKILFIVNKDCERIGHLGLHSFFSTSRLVEIDNVIRGKKNCYKGIMSRSLHALMRWYNSLATPECIYLRTTQYLNAIRFYESNGFFNDGTSMMDIYSEYSPHINDNALCQACKDSDQRYIVLRYHGVTPRV